MSQLSLFKKNPFYESKQKKIVESKNLFYKQSLFSEDLKVLQNIVEDKVEVKQVVSANPLTGKILVNKNNGSRLKVLEVNGVVKLLWLNNTLDSSKNNKTHVVAKHNLNLNFYDVYDEKENIPDFQKVQKSRILTPSIKSDSVDYKAKAERFKKLGDGLQNQIKNLYHPAIGNQNPTARRARIARAMWERGESLEEIQKAFYRLADFYSSKNIPNSLKSIKSKKDLEEIKWRKKNSEEYNLLFGEQRLDPEKQKQKILKEMETNLLGTKIPDFFPTPKSVIKEMLSYIPQEDFQRDKFLEPSAGKGDIADELSKYVGKSNIDVIETNYSLQKILDLKGYTLVADDFLQFDSKMYDYIIMNPPFSGMEDIEHVMHAYSLLRIGGKVISIMSEAPFFRSDKKAVHFRNWLESKNYDTEKLEPGSFTGNESFRQTGVNARIVVIRK